MYFNFSRSSDKRRLHITVEKIDSMLSGFIINKY